MPVSVRRITAGNGQAGQADHDGGARAEGGRQRGPGPGKVGAAKPLEGRIRAVECRARGIKVLGIEQLEAALFGPSPRSEAFSRARAILSGEGSMPTTRIRARRGSGHLRPCATQIEDAVSPPEEGLEPRLHDVAEQEADRVPSARAIGVRHQRPNAVTCARAS